MATVRTGGFTGLLRSLGRIAAAVAVVMIASVVASARASAAPVTVGPPDVSSGADTGGLSCGGNGTQLDCAIFNLSDNRGGLVQAPVDGTITSWSVGGLEGTGRLLVIAPAGGGRYTIVGESAQETEPCVMSDGACGGEFGAVNPQYTFATDLPIAAGDLLGIELISQSGCFTTANPTSEGCGFVGADASNPVAGTSTFWDQTPQPGVPTAPSSAEPIAEQVLVNAVEQPLSISQVQQTDLVQACDAAQAGTSPSSAISVDGYTVNVDLAEPGTLTASVAFDGSGGSGSSVLVFEGSGGSGSSVLVFDGSGGSGSSVLTFEGSGGSGSSVLTFDGSGGSGSSVLTFEGSSGSGSSVLTFTGGSPGSGPVLSSADTSPELALAAQQNAPLACEVTFDGSTGSGSSVAADAASQHHTPTGARLCIRETKRSKARCSKLRHVARPPVASLRRTIPNAGRVTLHIPLTKAGHLLLLTAREADRLYHRRHPRAHKHPVLRLRVTLSFKPAG